MPTTAPHIQALDWRHDPLHVLDRWHESRPLVALISSGAPSERWSIFASPSLSIDINDGVDPLAELDRYIQIPSTQIESPLPFTGGWIVALSYDLGRVLEPSAQCRTRDAARTKRDDVPLIQLHRCDQALVHDRQTSTWYAVWAPGAAHQFADVFGTTSHHGRSRPIVYDLASDTGEDEYVRMVECAVELIRAGDAFQVNLAHQLVGKFYGHPRDLTRHMLRTASPGFGAHLESPSGRTLCSMSPELFLDVDWKTRRVVTRPIKGTRRSSAATLSELQHSEKDQAELAMIVDLMRNDLGRVCEFGSVTVENARAIDQHGSSKGALLHASATVAGTLRSGIGLGALLRATFPPGSVTGAPKVRAMQMIDELEVSHRGSYCGAVGFVSDHGRCAFNVAIRTATIQSDGRLSFPVGAGIVADSNPVSEWNETLDKATMFTESLLSGMCENNGERLARGEHRNRFWTTSR